METLPLLLDLLKAGYEEGIRQSGFYRMDHVILRVLTEIALQNEENYQRVSIGIRQFIQTYLGKVKSINGLYAFLESLEQKYYVNRSKAIDIRGAITKLGIVNFLMPIPA